MNNKIKIYLKLYWLRILVIGILTLIGLSLIFALISSLKSWIHMESFYKEQMKASIGFQLYLTLITALLWGSIYTYMWYWMMFRGGGFREFSKMQLKALKGEEIAVRWKDVIGMEEAKKEAWEAVELIKEKASIQKIGGHIIRGIILIGPPGCGKTYLAKAIATECNLPFLSVVGSELEGIIVGLGAMKIRKLFKTARELAELTGGCIIFIDEIDSVARPRRGGFGFGGQESYNMAVNQLLAEMDGLRKKDLNIVVIAATNVMEDELDPALMRAGRFDRKIYIGLPSLEDREALFRFYLSKVNYDKNIPIDKLARLTVWNTPADIANIIKESSLIAIRHKRNIVTIEDINEAREKIALGIRLNIKMSEKDKKIAAYHEAGHTIVAYLLVPTKDVFKASIVPRKTYGGTTWFIKKEESYIASKEDILGEIKILLGGYAAEKIKFGITSTGVGEDLKSANELAEYMVSLWGMGTSGPSSVSNNTFSFRTRELAEKDKEDIINNCFNEVNELLRKEINILERVANELINKEELDYDSLEEIFKEFGKTRLMAKEEKKKEEEKIGWNDVIGMDEIKQEAMEIVNLIKDRAQLKQIGGRIIRGLLMFGPPGCGKTYLANVMANEAGVPFLAKTGSEFVELYVGVGASRIRRLFQEARELALAKGGCIIFIDEIDAVGAKRIQDLGSGGQTEYNQTLNQLLAEMDGLKEKELQYNIVVIGATNVKEDFLDPALLRPGRFDRKLYVDLPVLEDRKKLFEYYLSKVKYNKEEIDVEKLAIISSYYSPADIANLVRESALLAIRNKKDTIGIKEIEEARERIELGLKRRIKQTDEEKKAVAYHEAGHAIVCKLLSPERETFKLSIIPRKETGGILWAPEKEEMLTRDKIHLLNRIKVSLAGHVAEKIKCRAPSSGAEADFANALSTAHNMVWRWGMGKSGYIGNFHALDKNLISEEIKRKLDEDVQDIMKNCLEETEKILKENITLLDYLAEELLKKEELNYIELEEIFKKFLPKNNPAE